MKTLQCFVRVQEAHQQSIRFPIGVVYKSKAVIRLISEPEIAEALRRHQTGDWGLVDLFIATLNEQLIEINGSPVSLHMSGAGLLVHIVTNQKSFRTRITLKA